MMRRGSGLMSSNVMAVPWVVLPGTLLHEDGYPSLETASPA